MSQKPLYCIWSMIHNVMDITKQHSYFTCNKLLKVLYGKFVTGPWQGTEREWEKYQQKWRSWNDDGYIIPLKKLTSCHISSIRAVAPKLRLLGTSIFISHVLPAAAKLDIKVGIIHFLMHEPWVYSLPCRCFQSLIELRFTKHCFKPV